MEFYGTGARKGRGRCKLLYIRENKKCNEQRSWEDPKMQNIKPQNKDTQCGKHS